MTIKNVLICGLGAIGTIYAVKLQNYEKNMVKILVDENRLTKYCETGTYFNEKRYDFDYILPNFKDYKADLIIIATKNNGLDDAIKNIKNFIYEKTIIISLLNGIDSEDKIIEKYGKKCVLYSYFIGHTSSKNGRKITHDGVGTIVFGSIDNTNQENINRLKNFFDIVGIDYKIPEDMQYARFSKFMLNVGLNQVSSVLLSPYIVFQKCEKPLNLVIKLFEEVREIAKEAGVKNYDKLIPDALKMLEIMLPIAKTSMLQDVEARRICEVDIFAKSVCNLGKKYNVKTPYNQIFYEILSAINEKNEKFQTLNNCLDFNNFLKI